MFNFRNYIIAGLLTLSALALRADLPLAENGKAAASIAVPAKSDITLDYAAQELQLWIKKISGAELPIVKDATSAEAMIVLDPTSANFPEDAAKFKGNDGYSVRQKGNKVYLNASCSKGILNGVFRMLYKNSDIIWARPDPEFGTVYTPNPNLTLTKTNYIDIPKFLLRGWQMPPAYKNKNRYHNFIWQTRNGTNWNSLESGDINKKKFGTVMEDGGGHNIVGRFIREKKYFKTHPEFYPLKNGKRMQPSKHKGSVQLCFTNQEMIKAFINEVDERIRRNPQFSTYRIMNEDNRNLCECPECMKPVVLPDGTTVEVKDPAFRSTQFFLFLNQVARHVKAKYPDKRILTFAYLFTVIPPKCKVEDNIDISFAPISKDAKFDITAPQSAKTMKQFMDWIKITRNITLREYYGLGGDFPRAIDKTAFGDWQYMYKHGVRRTYSEMRGDSKYNAFLANTWDMNSMHYWVLTQGCWDPMQDYKTLRMEFLTRVYGAAAAPDIAEFYEITGNEWLKLSSRSIWNEIAHSTWQDCVISKPAVAAACRAALKRAESKVKPAGKRYLTSLQAAFDVHMNFEAKKIITGKRTSGNPGLDPDFSTAAWLAAPVYDQFFHNAGTKRHENKTEVRMLFDNENIYVGVKCEYPDVKKMRYRPLRAGKNAVPHGEGFEVILTHKAGKKPILIHVATDPSGNRFSGGHKTNWKNEVKITDYGWCALFVIPWKDLKLSPKNADKVRGQFLRQFKVAAKEGDVPWTAAVLFTGRRRQAKFYHPVEFDLPAAKKSGNAPVLSKPAEPGESKSNGKVPGKKVDSKPDLKKQI